jgi:exoribonuclease R
VSEKKKVYIVGFGIVGLLAGALGYKLKDNLSQNHSSRNKSSTDEALLALIKHDMPGFQKFITDGGNVHANLPEIDGHTFTVSEGMAYFDRADFAKYLQDLKITFVDQKPKAEFDIFTVTVDKNNLDLLTVIAKEKAKLSQTYGDKNWTLLHMASAACAHKVVPLLHLEGQLKWSDRAKDGATPLTIAAENDCLPVLSYWKDHGADFKAKDGRGMTALSILSKKKDAALVAFAESFIQRRPASVTIVAPKEVSFYRKRVIPKEKQIDHSALIEPEDRPLETTETAENSEFAD